MPAQIKWNVWIETDLFFYLGWTQLMFMYVLERYVASTVLLVPQRFRGHWRCQWTVAWRERVPLQWHNQFWQSFEEGAGEQSLEWDCVSVWYLNCFCTCPDWWKGLNIPWCCFRVPCCCCWNWRCRWWMRKMRRWRVGTDTSTVCSASLGRPSSSLPQTVSLGSVLPVGCFVFCTVQEVRGVKGKAREQGTGGRRVGSDRTGTSLFAVFLLALFLFYLLLWSMSYRLCIILPYFYRFCLIFRMLCVRKCTQTCLQTAYLMGL